MDYKKCLNKKRKGDYEYIQIAIDGREKLMNIEQLQSFFGWCAVLNYGVLLFSTVILLGFPGSLWRFVSKFSKLSDSEFQKLYFQFLAMYKGITIIFNIIPYVVIRFLI